MIINLDKRIWLFVLGFFLILIAADNLSHLPLLRVSKIFVTQIMVLIFIIAVVISSHKLLIGLKLNSRVFYPKIIIPLLVLFIGVNVYSSPDYINFEINEEFIFLLLVAFLQSLNEELIFRGIIFSNYLLNTDSLILSAIFSSILFAAFHLLGINRGIKISSLLHQLIFAFSTGFFLCSILTFFNNIFISVGIHFGLNYFSYSSLNFADTADNIPIQSFTILNIIFSIICYSPYIIIGCILFFYNRDRR